MTVFCLICAGLIAGALALILPPLLRPLPATTGSNDANLELYREQLAEMESRLGKGEEFDLERRDLERRLAEDLPEIPASPSSNASVPSRVIPLILAGGLPLLAIFLYLELGSPQLLTATPQMPAGVKTALEKARQEPENFDAQVQAAQFYYQIQRYDEARDLLLKANRIQPDDYATLVNLGLTNSEAGHMEEAERWYRQALTREPDDTRVLSDYASVLILQRKPDAARAIVDRLGTLDPTNPDLPRLQEALTKP